MALPIPCGAISSMWRITLSLCVGSWRAHPPSLGVQNTGLLRASKCSSSVGVFQRLLYPLYVAHLLTGQLLARAQQRAHLLRRAVRDEARPDQAVRQQIRHPVGIFHVALAARHVLDMCGI